MVTDSTSVTAPVVALPTWLQHQTLKSVPTPGYVPAAHAEALSLMGERLVLDQSIASGKLSGALRAIADDPTLPRTALTDEVFNGNSGYTMQVMWPVIAIFAGHMPKRVSASTVSGYLGWVNRIGRVVLTGLEAPASEQVHAVLDGVTEALTAAVGVTSVETSEITREVEDASERVDTNEPGIYVFTTPTYLAYPPFGWFTDDPSRQDFRYLKTGSTTVDMSGRIHSEIRRQTGLPEPYLILAKFTGATDAADYPSIERQIHRLLNAARHGPEEDGTRRPSSRGAGTEWFITRLPFVIAIAESLGLMLSMPEELKARVNDILEDCDLPDWLLN